MGDKLSKDDLYRIGLAHRELPKIERSWSWLLSLTGGFPSSEAYRGFVLKRLTHSGELKNNIQDNITSEKHELYKERQKLRDERATLNRMLRDEARVERFLEELKEEARTLNEKMPLPKVKYEGKVKGEVEAVALFSDLHLGIY